MKIKEPNICQMKKNNAWPKVVHGYAMKNNFGLLELTKKGMLRFAHLTKHAHLTGMVDFHK